MSYIKYVRTAPGADHRGGRHIFVRDGVYFVLTVEDFDYLRQYFEEVIKDEMEKEHE